MKKLPTDLQILNEIYERYYETFCSHSQDQSRSAEVLVPIDIRAIARTFSVDPHIIFGRLYYHLNRKYGYTEADGAKVSFFTIRTGKEIPYIQFPLLASVLASLREEHGRDQWTRWLSIAAIAIALASFLISVVKQ
jgi:hypothetical protein